MTEYESKLSPFVAGLTLAGYELPSGRIRSAVLNGQIIEEWPKEIVVFGTTFTLESVHFVGDDPDGSYMNAEYV